MDFMVAREPNVSAAATCKIRHIQTNHTQYPGHRYLRQLSVFDCKYRRNPHVVPTAPRTIDGGIHHLSRRA
jgi:hypothetical protein